MAPLRLWAWIAVGCVISGSLTWAQEIESTLPTQEGASLYSEGGANNGGGTPLYTEGRNPSEGRELQKLDLLVKPGSPAESPKIRDLFWYLPQVHRIPQGTTNVRVIPVEGRISNQVLEGELSSRTWGEADNVYPDDSLLSSAAVHACVFKKGQTIRFTIMSGQAWGGSYRTEGAAKVISSVYELRGQGTAPFAVYVAGRVDGVVWGSGSYTDDSDLGTAAVHAGLLKPGEASFVTVTLEGGQAAYESSTQNGVTSHPCRSWDAGFWLSKFEPNVHIQPGWSGFTFDEF